ncbi:MgtC/SapB family protein [Rhodohalobacter sulfatireducens]|uniref:MgtC/SapB family protein n=1 Tax=Rhodohalobacter sulfatireducens TaxID=2911366 RepID=A0ABS9KFJ9_9BACT|nr:MgtC/SapB family protein [Rhodohalobacter sulfatireducens]MCG2589629.1 MgtC/SapB family protein [Rhodohalobacter sulfatireducens]MDR9364726.1 MgtC/SapB family protein [Balneolaceae bacterium]MDR9408539.1 MgtC/SapB family protein [Balneolaceae bacterium]
MESALQWEVVGKVAFAIFLGGLIGLEREWASKPAGFRTHMLIAGASTLFVILGDIMIHQFAQRAMPEMLQTDPIRIMEAIITGISFLGAGTIIFKDQINTVEGLTTAASILFVAGIGIAVALSLYTLSFLLTAMVILVLLVLGFVQNRIEGYHQ